MKNVNDLEVWYDENFNLFEKLVDKAQSIIIDTIKENNIQINSISGRVKEKDSFCTKALKDKYIDPINEITDMAGIRIIAYVNSDVDKISKIIEDEFDVDKDKSIDKGNLLGVDKVGYKSVHYILKLTDDRTKLTEYKSFKNMCFEVQIRTLLQHAWSEIEHDRNYKFSGVLPEEIKREFALLAGTLELVDMHFESISKKIDLYSDNITQKLLDNDLEKVLINSTSIKVCLNEVFSEEVKNNIMEPVLGNDDIVIKELNEFGIENIQQLRNLMKNKLIYNTDHKINKYNFIGALRDAMIKTDTDKYFSKVWHRNWDGLNLEDRKLFIRNGIDFDRIIEKYRVTFID